MPHCVMIDTPIRSSIVSAMASSNASSSSTAGETPVLQTVEHTRKCGVSSHPSAASFGGAPPVAAAGPTTAHQRSPRDAPAAGAGHETPPGAARAPVRGNAEQSQHAAGGRCETDMGAEAACEEWWRGVRGERRTTRCCSSFVCGVTAGEEVVSDQRTGGRCE